MGYNFLDLKSEDGVGIITINKPPANAISYNFILELKDLVLKIEADEEIRCVLFRSNVKKFFSAGADLTDLPPDAIAKLSKLTPGSDLKQFIKDVLPSVSARLADIFREVHEVYSMVENMKKPTIAVINGHALGGGLELALTCDFRFMGRNSGKVGLPELKLGLIPLGGGTQRLPRLIGKSKAVELLIDANKIEADEAFSIGLVSKVFESDKVDEEALAFAKKMAKGPTYSIGLLKNCVNKGLDKELPEGLKIEINSFNDLIKSEDMIEGILSFLEKREPHYIGK
jgi:enoyl-CoA hydratase/carnithine racemase